MLFENKTNSKILSELNIDERILKFGYMKGRGQGLELLELLHTVVSPEEIFKHYKAFNMTAVQVKKLRNWLKHNCKMSETVKDSISKYGYHQRDLFEDGRMGILTKIRRYVVEWEPKVNANGEIEYEEFAWLNAPEVVFQNEDTIALKRKYNDKYYYVSMCDHNQVYDSQKDKFYGKQLTVYKLENNKWRRAKISEKLDIIDTIQVIEEFVN